MHPSGTSFQYNNSECIATIKYDIPRTAVHRVLYKGLNFQAYKVQILQALEPDIMPCRLNFAIEMLECINSETDFLRRHRFTNGRRKFSFVCESQLSKYEEIRIKNIRIMFLK